MTVTRELSISYGGFSVGGSTARQVTDYPMVESAYENGVFEFSFITSAATAAAFQTEIAAVEAAFRKPRQDLTVTYGSGNTVSWKQSDNTGFDANPVITKRGDIGDSGRSRRYWVRIEFGLPADNVSTSFRRYSTVSINYSPTRIRTVTINGVYTANSTDGTTGSIAQYLAQIATYATTVLSGISASASWEKISEPDVSRNETDKVTQFTTVYREIIFNQAQGVVNNAAIVNPTLTISREREAPGDSDGIKLKFATSVGGGGTQVQPFGVQVGSAGAATRPITLNVVYSCGVDYTATQDLTGLWTNTIRPFIINTVKALGSKVVLVNEKPNYGEYDNTFSASMQFLSYESTIFQQTVEVEDSTFFGKSLVGVWDKNPFAKYKFQSTATRTKTITEDRQEITATTDANDIAEGLRVGIDKTVQGIADADHWTIMNRTPSAVSLRQGLAGGTVVYIARIKVTTVLEYGDFVKPSIANAGGVTGSTVTA